MNPTNNLDQLSINTLRFLAADAVQKAKSGHPDAFLETLEQDLDKTQAKISEICRGKRGVTPDMAMRLDRLFGPSPLFWLNLQKNWELSQLDEATYASIEPLRLTAVAT